MAAPILLSLEAQQLYFQYICGIFSMSILLNIVSLVFLIKFTLPNQASWRTYMLSIQVVLISIDVYVDILLKPIPLVPAPAGFTSGFLCNLGIPIQIQGGIAIVLLANLVGVLILCVLHRHQSILVGPSRFRLSKVQYRAVHFLLVAVYSFPGIYFCTISVDKEAEQEMIKNDPHNLTWITERDCCYIYMQRDFILDSLFLSTVLVIISSAFLLAFLFIHTNHILKRDLNKRRFQSIKNARKSVKRLFVQLFTPFLVLTIPATIIAASFINEEIVSFEFCLSAFSVMYLYGIAHNILLLSITPVFRKKIVQFLFD